MRKFLLILGLFYVFSSPAITALAAEILAPPAPETCAILALTSQYIDTLSDSEFQQLGTQLTKQEFKEDLKNLCIGSMSLGGKWVRNISLTGSVTTSLATFPIRFVSKFGIGFFTRKATPNPGPGLGDYMGKTFSQAIWFSAYYQQALVVFFKANPWSIVSSTVVGMDLFLAQECSPQNPRREQIQKLCKIYAKIKRMAFEGTEAAEGPGVNAGNWALKFFDFRPDDTLNAGLCKTSPQHQIKIAKRAVERLALVFKKNSITDTKIQILAPQIHGCVSIHVSSSQAEKLKMKWIDGIVLRWNDKDPIELETVDDKTLSDDQKVCRYVHGLQVSRSMNREKKRSNDFQSVQAQINASRFAQLSLKSINTDPTLLQKDAGDEKGRNIVLVISPHGIYSDEEVNEAMKYYKSLMKTRKLLVKKMNYLVDKTTDYEDCLQKQESEEHHFDAKAFDETNNAIANLSVASRMIELKQFMKQFKKVKRAWLPGRRLKQHWELVEMNTIDDIRTMVSDPHVKNLVIVSHGDSNGKVIDSGFNELPSLAFEWISPELLSLSFFSCHSSETANTYTLEESFKTQASTHPVRFLGHVNSSSIFESQNEVPTLALSSFIHDLDLALNRAEKAEALAGKVLPKQPSSSVNTCQITLEAASISKGSLGLTLNDHWIGSLYPHSIKQETFTFPCSWKAKGKNSLYLQNFNLKEETSLMSDQFTITVGEKKYAPESVFKRKDQSLKGARFIWNEN